jgi:hypothetical protein
LLWEEASSRVSLKLLEKRMDKLTFRDKREDNIVGKKKIGELQDDRDENG